MQDEDEILPCRTAQQVTVELVGLGDVQIIGKLGLEAMRNWHVAGKRLLEHRAYRACGKGLPISIGSSLRAPAFAKRTVASLATMTRPSLRRLKRVWIAGVMAGA